MDNAAIIKQSVSMEDLVERYGFHPNRAGFICCPFHGEKTPSLKIYPGSAGWYCFGCGKGGSAIDFTMEMESLSFADACKQLDGYYNLGLYGMEYQPEKYAEIKRKQEEEAHKKHMDIEKRNALSKYRRELWLKPDRDEERIAHLDRLLESEDLSGMDVAALISAMGGEPDLEQGPKQVEIVNAGEIVIPDYRKEDFFTDAPFEFLFQFRGNRLISEQMTQRMISVAKKLGVTGFLKMYAGYLADHKPQNEQGNVTMFDGQQQEYFCGGWTATEEGIVGTDRFGMEVVACYHPILPVERLVNVDTGLHKVKLAYKLSRGWQTVIEDKSVISDGRSIISLSRYGINVTSDNAKSLVRYLADVEHYNYSRIPETASVGRLGWIDGFGFSPFDGNLVFDGEEEYRSRFDAIREKGSLDKWMDCLLKIRADDSRGGKIARIVIAASLASVLVKPMKCLPFFVHLWGGTETGKTVSLLVAASMWADPEIGRYIQTFNSTEVGKEMGAAFCNSLPLIIDELQLVKDNRKDFDKMIYQLAQGAGRTRGRRQGGLQMTPEWKNCIITTGEFPILSENSGGGSVNRVLEIDCHDTKLFADPRGVAACVYDNFGFCGKEFVRCLQEGGLEEAEKVWREFDETLKLLDGMDKQTASAALVLAADTLAERWIFRDGKKLSCGDLAGFLRTKEEVDQNARALEFIQDFVAINQAKFSNSADSQEVWGRVDGDEISIVKSKFVKIMEDEGYNAKAFLGWAVEHGIVQRGDDSRPKRIAGRTARCVCLRCSESLQDIDDYIP